MAYVLQSFSSGAILTNSQLFQTEENIATHVHGLDGVTGAGVSIKRETKTQAFTIQPSDSGKLFECYDAPYDGTFQSAGALGDNFAILIKNRDTVSPILLLAASGQTIDGRSGYLLAPYESVAIYGNSSALYTNGANDPVIVYNTTLAASAQEIEIDLTASANHFVFFELYATGLTSYDGNSTRQTRMRISTDSLQNFLGDGVYDNTAFGGDTNFIALMNTNGAGTYIAVRYNQGTDTASRSYPVFDVNQGTGLLVTPSGNANFASVDSPGVVHGLLLYPNGDHIRAERGNGIIVKAYGRK